MNQYPSAKSLNILKASLPFMPPTMRNQVSVMVRAFECNNMYHEINNSLDETLSACSVSGNIPFNPNDLLYAIKPYLSGKEANTINTFMNIQNIMKMYQGMDSSSGFAGQQGQNMMNIFQSMMGANPQNSSVHSSESDKLREDSINALKNLLNNNEKE